MLKQRIITAVVLAAAFFGALFGLPTRQFAWVMLVALMVAAYEWAQLSGFRRVGTLVFCASVFATGFVLLQRASTPGGVFFLEPLLLFCGLASLFWIFIAPMWLRNQWATRNAPVMAVLGFVLTVALWMAMVELHGFSPWLTLGAMFIVSLADIAAYFSGRKFGKRKLAPVISPNKTWEGVYGALVCVALYAVLVVTLSSLSSYSIGARVALVVIAVGLGGISVVGDLFESVMKRQAGVKDSGHTLPGHGGILDRIDAQFPVLPIAALVAVAFTSLVS